MVNAQSSQARPVVVLDVVGLCRAHLLHMPFLRAWAEQRSVSAIQGVLPAVTTTVQSTYLTGRLPRDHGIVGNGWYFRDECEVKFWRQSNHLVRSAKLWDMARARDPELTVANAFWWYAMYADVDYTVTPRPQYHSDGLKIPDIYTRPAQLREQLSEQLGRFPLFEFWGPRTTIRSSRWIADAAQKIYSEHQPTLNLVYLPHLDYNAQRYGAEHDSVVGDLAELDVLCRDTIEFYEARGVEVIVLSEYAITDVSNPVYVNRALREAGLIAVREESGCELLDAGASAAFAAVDHQVAHIYVRDRSRIAQVRALVAQLPGVEQVLDRAEQAQWGLDHSRSGELVAVADAQSWFAYPYWLDDARAPDFARSVDIHRKPGYDPCELFIDPHRFAVPARLALSLLRKKLGFRYRMASTPFDASLVRGSHGRVSRDPQRAPILISRHDAEEFYPALSICGHILARLFRGAESE